MAIPRKPLLHSSCTPSTANPLAESVLRCAGLGEEKATLPLRDSASPSRHQHRFRTPKLGSLDCPSCCLRCYPTNPRAAQIRRCRDDQDGGGVCIGDIHNNSLRVRTPQSRRTARREGLAPNPLSGLSGFDAVVSHGAFRCEVRYLDGLHPEQPGSHFGKVLKVMLSINLEITTSTRPLLFGRPTNPALLPLG